MTVIQTILTRTALLIIAVLSLSLCLFSHDTYAYDELYGPGIEIGAGLTSMQSQSSPGWVSDRYNAGFATAALRLYKGLSVQGGFGYGQGGDPDHDWVDMQNGKRLWTQESSNIDFTFYGLRYEFPMYRFNLGKVGPDFIYVAAGLDRRKYKIESSVIDDNGEPVQTNPERYTLATLDGRYYTLAGRWKVKTDDTVAGDSWFGSFGVDLGLKLVQYSDSEMKFGDTEQFSSSFNSLEIFLTAFMKIRLFD